MYLASRARPAHWIARPAPAMGMRALAGMKEPTNSGFLMCARHGV